MPETATLLVLSLLPLVAAPWIAAAAAKRRAASVALDAALTVSVAGLLLFGVLPTAVRTAGSAALVAAIAGVLLPWVLHRWWHHREARQRLLPLALIALLLHGAIDGIALAAEGNNGLVAAVLLHRLPMALAIWWLTRPRYGVGGAMLLLAALGVSTVVGLLGGDTIWHQLTTPTAAVALSFVSGLLLHLIFDHHGPAAERARDAAERKARLFGTGLAVAGLTALAYDHGTSPLAPLLLGIAYITLRRLLRRFLPA